MGKNIGVMGCQGGKVHKSVYRYIYIKTDEFWTFRFTVHILYHSMRQFRTV